MASKGGPWKAGKESLCTPTMRPFPLSGHGENDRRNENASTGENKISVFFTNEKVPRLVFLSACIY